MVDQEHLPHFIVNQTALSSYHERPEVKRAYFAMGCFWGSEALLASAPGVVGTRVGFSGGTLANPSYSAIGDHVETVEVLYDARETSYGELLLHFWAHHNSRAKPVFRQYASAIFVQDEEQKKTAKRLRSEWQERTGEKKVLTAILDFEKFYLAAESHQKYYLQQDQVLYKALPASNTKLDSILATKLNAVSGRAGERELLEEALGGMGIDQEARQELFKRALWPEENR